MPAQHVLAADGTQLSVRVTGQSDGPAVLLCDGIGCDGYIWRYLRPALELRCQVVHWHYRGHGQSGLPSAGLGTAGQASLTIEQASSDAWHLLSALAIERVVLIGHSMGVQVILQMAHDQPERVRALVAVCGAFERPLDTFHNSDLGTRILPLLSGAAFRFPSPLRRVWQRLLPTDLAYQAAIATEINGDLIQRDDFLPYLQHLSRMDPLVFLAFLQSAAAHTARPWLRSLHMPTLVFAGDRDHFTPRHLQEQMAVMLPDAELCTVAGGSHAAPLELPEHLELRIEAFSRSRGLGILGN